MTENVIEHNGIKFYKPKKENYYIGEVVKNGVRKVCRLHRYIWEENYGEIPEGYHIHHKDKDFNNNSIDNLEMLEAFEHLSNHSKENREQSRKSIEKARPYAIEWHKSKKGREWHKKHYEKTKEKLYKKTERSCIVCGKTFLAIRENNIYCSNNCKAKDRRKSGIDNVTRQCIVCGKDFVISRYSKTMKCEEHRGRWNNG